MNSSLIYVIVWHSLCVIGTSTFRFRRYREEVALRSRQKIDGENDDENDASIDSSTKKMISKEERDDDDDKNDDDDDDGGGGGTVLQNLSDAVIVIDAHGKVLIEKTKMTKETSDVVDVDIDIESDNGCLTEEDEKSKRRKSVSVVPEGTTLLLRNLRDCRVTM